MVLLFLNGIIASISGFSNVAGAQPVDEKILFIIPPEFSFDEYDTPRKMLEEWGYSLTFSMLHEFEHVYNDDFVLTANTTIQEIENISIYDCIYVVGTLSFQNFAINETVHDILIAANEAELLISAICSGSYALACAGIVVGKNMTGYEPLKESLVVYLENKTRRSIPFAEVEVTNERVELDEFGEPSNMDYVKMQESAEVTATGKSPAVKDSTDKKNIKKSATEDKIDK